MNNGAYFSAFGQILLYIVGGLVFVLLTLFASRMLRPNRPNQQKLASYESGEEPITVAWTQFNIRFYIVALVFLLFEAEIVFLFPWATIFAQKELVAETNGAWAWLSLVEMIIFIAVLALGLAYAWVNGHLDWVKPNAEAPDYQSPVPEDQYERINEQYRKK